MATMLNGTAVMDSALLIIAANQSVPQPQTAEHLAASEIMNLKQIICVQTKLDLIKTELAQENHKQIQNFVVKTVAEKSPIIPVSCTPNSQYNVDVLLQYLAETIPIPKRDFTSPPLLTVVRSFDINQPGSVAGSLKGGIAGGTLKRGVLQLGDTIEIRPGLMTKDSNGIIHCHPLITIVRSLYSEQNSMKFAVPGGLIAIGTSLDPALTMGDRLVGQVIGKPGSLPEVYQDLQIKFCLMNRLIGVKGEQNVKPEKVKPITLNELLMVNIGSTSTYGWVQTVKKNEAQIILRKPCCVEIGEHVSLSRNVNGGHRLIGSGQIIRGVPLSLKDLHQL